jgi:acyl-CoA hydrolase
LVYVALDDLGKPIEVPRLIVETAEEQRQWKLGKQRQADRLARLQREGKA